jgi:esterase/lipase superfamily enzyme
VSNNSSEEVIWKGGSKTKADHVNGPKWYGKINTYAVTTVKVFYATDRQKITHNDGSTSYGNAPDHLGDPVDYGRVEVSIPPSHKRGKTERPPSFLWIKFRKEDPGLDIVVAKVTPLTRDQVIKGLQSGGYRDKAILIFVHGFDNSFDDAAARTGQLAHDLNFPGQAMFFSWPSSNWLAGYFQDATVSKWAASDLADVLEHIDKDSDVKHIVIIAHSMGNWVVSSALQIASPKCPDLQEKVSHLIMAAPDIDAREFQMVFAPVILSAAKSVTLYVSSNDRALQESERLNSYLRLGDSRSGPIVIPPIETIDASADSADFIGHAYVSNSVTVLDDIAKVISNQSASKRGLSPELNNKQLQYWRLNPETTP